MIIKKGMRSSIVLNGRFMTEFETFVTEKQ